MSRCDFEPQGGGTCECTRSGRSVDGLCTSCLLGSLRTQEPTPEENTRCLEWIGEYRLDEMLAQGRMGVVYKACHAQIGRVVAVKTLPAAQFATPAQRLRFRFEFLASADLEHPHIVPVYELAEFEGQLFYAMRYFKWGSLASAAARMRLFDGRNGRLDGLGGTQASVGRFMVALARAVEFVHRRGIAHCDLKPSNILVGDRGAPVIADFGSAMILGGLLNSRLPGLVLGTPSYMAPEQIEGDLRKLTAATDVYGLGTILYYLLTEHPPFRAQTVWETLLQVRSENPRRPATWGFPVDRDLEAICLKCLSKNPTERYSTAGALAAALEAWCASAAQRGL